jgi:hypothetical protein
MFRERYNPLKNKRGYLYLRETEYLRDKRTLKKKPSKLGDGKATKERWKYSVKKETYLGKIVELELKNILTFQEYVEKILKKDYLEEKINLSFDQLTDLFVSYILFSYEIDKNDFLSEKKRVYLVFGGYLSKITLNWFKNFNIRINYSELKEFERFRNRALDIGIYDDEIIALLFQKLTNTSENKNFDKDFLSIEKKNIKNDDFKENDLIKKTKIKKLREFIKKSIED